MKIYKRYVVDDVLQPNPYPEGEGEIYFPVPEIFEILDAQIKEYRLLPLNFRFTRLFENSNGEFVHNKPVKYSVPIEEVQTEIMNRFTMETGQFQRLLAEQNIYMAIILPGRDIVKDDIVRCMEQMNWNLSNISDMQRKKRDGSIQHYYQLVFEPMYSHNANDEVKKMRYLYHVSSYKNLPSIKASGLIPKSENYRFKYPERVYLIKGIVNDKEIEKIGTELFASKYNYDNDEKFIKFVIDTYKLDNVDFYLDPTYKYGVYTYDEIPYSAVASVRLMKINNKQPILQRTQNFLKKLFGIKDDLK